MLCTTLGMPARALRSTAALRAASAPRSAALRCAASLLPPSRAGARRGVAAKAEPALLVAADGGPGSLPLTVTGLLSLLAAARLAFTGGGPAAAAEPAAAPPPPPPPPPKPENAVLVFGATGRLGRAVVAALLAEGRFVVAAVRSASASKAATMLPTSHPRLLVRTGVDTTDAATLGDSLFEGVTQAVVATAGLFGPLPGGGMGFVDGYTSERVDRDGVANVAAACAARLAPAAPPSFAPVCAFDGAAELGRWGPKDDSIMGGSSASGWSLVEGGDAQGPGAGPHGRWSGTLVLPGGGFCGTRLDGLRLDASAADGLAVTLRAPFPPQRLKLSLRTRDLDGSSEAAYQAVVDPAGAAPLGGGGGAAPPPGGWAVVRLPWAAFLPVVRQNEAPSAPPLNPACVASLTLVLSRFEFNGQPNFAFSGGDFAVDVAGIAPYAAPRPSLVLVSSAGAERSARIGDDAAARGADVPIVQLNPGGVLTHKYHGEAAVRSHAARGLTYTVLRPTGLDAPDAAAAAAPAGPPPPPPALEFAQGDWASGTLSRADVAAAVASALRTPRACGVTAELRRVAPGSSDRAPAGPAALDAAWGRLAPDAGRTAAGLRPLPAPGPVPPPPTPEQVAALMARPDVAAAAARNKAAREAAAAAEQAAAGAQGAAAETAAAAR